MPNNNDDFNSLPKLNQENEKPEVNGEQPVQPTPVNNPQNNQPQKPIIEIPQKYFDNCVKKNNNKKNRKF